MSSSEQIRQMCQFIRQEAAEKCEEIRTNAEKEFLAQTEELLSKKREELEKLYEKKKKDLIIQQRIKKSTVITSAHFQSMEARDRKVKAIKAEVLTKLSDVSKNRSYPELIRFLIVQGLMMMMEKHITVRCRAEDKQIVQAQLAPAIKQFQDIMEAATGEKGPDGQQTAGVRPACELAIDSESLPPAPTADASAAALNGIEQPDELKAPSCCGGVYLIAKGGKIVCDNTLDTRLNLAYEALAPEIRGTLFGVREPAVYKDKPVEHH